MHLRKTRKLQKQTVEGSISVTLPKPIVDLLGWEAGMKVDVCLDTDNPKVVIKLVDENISR